MHLINTLIKYQFTKDCKSFLRSFSIVMMFGSEVNEEETKIDENLWENK